MEANIKQQQLTFEKGITNVPSDAICSDNALAESVGLVWHDGEHHVIQHPHSIGTIAENATIIYVHKYNDQTRYIGYFSYLDDTHLEHVVYGYFSEDFTLIGVLGRTSGRIDHFFYEEGAKISSIGKTLIVADSTGMHYFLWQTDGYEVLGDSFPRPEVKFKLGDNLAAADTIVVGSDVLYNNGGYLHISKQEEWNDAVVGMYTSLRKKVWQSKRFHGSFCIRAALELYDGTYFHISNPIFMVNRFSAHCIADFSNTAGPYAMSMEAYGQKLYYSFSQDYSKWIDIIKNVVLFVTEEARLFDTAVDAPLIWQDVSDATPRSYYMNGNTIYRDSKTVGHTPNSYKVLVSIPDSEVVDTIKQGVYYRLCEIGLVGDGEYHPASDHFRTHTLETITTQPQLLEDDYYSHTQMKASTLYAYNSRLNLANVSRGFFSGFDFFMPYERLNPSSPLPDPAPLYTFLVSIQTDGGMVVVSKTVQTTVKQGLYFYYPDPRARHVVIKRGDTQILNEDLTEHPTLNGAYYFAGISPTMDEPASATGDIPEVSPASVSELLPNYIIQSEVNNPFVFKAEGYHKVGTGKILGMSTTTMALSQDQFGKTDLLVFSDSGLWGLQVNSTGIYDSIHPITRDVCTNAASITQTDGAVFFVSDKGLMVVSEAGVRCVSPQLSGKAGPYAVGGLSFQQFLASAFIAYDYRDSLLWLFNADQTTCYVYAIASGTFSKYTFPTPVVNVVNAYPDYLLQTAPASQPSEVFSLIRRPDINDTEELSSNTYAATLVSRPMKLENGLALKSLRQVRHIAEMQPAAAVALTIEASNNLSGNWYQLSSLRGRPWKYYRFRYAFSGLKATDRFAGSIIITQERRTDKLR